MLMWQELIRMLRVWMELMSGDFVKVKVTGADDYDLIGEIDDESAE